MRKKAGFTLIELLVVVAIIAVLISILVPSLKAAREQAKQVVCLSNLRQVGMIFSYYAEDNKGDVPPGDPFPEGPDQWFMKLIPYIFTQYHINDWGQIEDAAGSVVHNMRYIGWELYDCPSYKQPSGYYPWPDAKMNVYGYYNANPPGWVPVNLWRLKNASEMVLLAEMDGDNWFVVPDEASAPGYSLAKLPTDRHNGKTNVLWADGHADSQETMELTETLEWWHRKY